MVDPLQALISRLRFRHLRMLMEVRRCGSIGKAAGALNLTQPALSKMLQEVEEAFGFSLYRRTPRGLLPTPQGDAVLQGASVLLHELAHLHESARASLQQSSAVLHLGVPATVAAATLPAVLTHLRAADLSLLIRLREDPVSVLFDALLEGELDALLTSFTPSLITARASPMVVERCVDHAYAVIASADHRLARRRKVAWQELVDERWILPEPSLLARQGVEAYFVHAGIAVPQPEITANNPATIVQLVAAGLGISWAAEGAIAAEERIGRIARLRVPLQARRVPTALVYRAGTAGHPVLQQLRQAVVATRNGTPVVAQADGRARR